MKYLAARISNSNALSPVGVDGTAVVIVSIVGEADWKGIMAVCMDGDGRLRQIPVDQLKITPVSRAEILDDLGPSPWLDAE